jgi:hypothetical protein
MKKYIPLLFLTLLLLPNFANADRPETIEIKGVIGDSAPQSRTYEVDGKIYEFDEDITIQTPSGDALTFADLKGGMKTFADLKGGMKIKIIAEKVPGPDGKEKIRYISIIVMKKQQAAK